MRKKDTRTFEHNICMWTRAKLDVLVSGATFSVVSTFDPHSVLVTIMVYGGPGVSPGNS